MAVFYPLVIYFVLEHVYITINGFERVVLWLVLQIAIADSYCNCVTRRLPQLVIYIPIWQSYPRAHWLAKYGDKKMMRNSHSWGYPTNWSSWAQYKLEKLNELSQTVQRSKHCNLIRRDFYCVLVLMLISTVVYLVCLVALLAFHDIYQTMML